MIAKLNKIRITTISDVLNTKHQPKAVGVNFFRMRHLASRIAKLAQFYVGNMQQIARIAGQTPSYSVISFTYDTRISFEET